MAADWQNDDLPADVDASQIVAPNDVLTVIDRLNAVGAHILPARPADSTEPYYDVNGDGVLAPLDALVVINLINRQIPDPTMAASLSAQSDPNGNRVVVQDVVVANGQTDPGARVLVTALAGQTGTWEAAADDAGQFSVTLPLAGGANQFEVAVRNAMGHWARDTVDVFAGDLAQDWNAAILNVVRQWSSTSDDPFEGRTVYSAPPEVARNLAIIHGAMFEAHNSFQPQYESYWGPSTPGGAPPEDGAADVAAAAAAYRAASALYGQSAHQAVWDATLAESLTVAGGGNSHSDSVTFGYQIAEAMLAHRSDDGSDVAGTHTAGDQPGDWDRTPPDYLPPLLPAWADVTPFALDAADQFRPAAPPALDSAAYAHSVDEVLRLGGVDSTLRTADQDEIAEFWADGAGTYTPPGHWNQIASEAVAAEGWDLSESTRMFALLNYALADAGIAAWDAKYGYDFWRPIDAIRQAHRDGNDATTPVADWTPRLPSPPFPTYTSGHSTFSGAAAEVLTRLFGDGFAFTTTIDPAATSGDNPAIISRSFDSFWDAAEEAGMSRIYGGIHFDFDNTAGLDSGRSVGAWTAERLLAPLPT